MVSQYNDQGALKRVLSAPEGICPRSYRTPTAICFSVPLDPTKFRPTLTARGTRLPSLCAKLLEP